MLTGEPGMDGPELAAWRRFYRRHPFGLLRGDLQAWLVARNAAEAWSGRLRPSDRAALGQVKHPTARRGRPVDWRRIKTRVTRERLADLAAETGRPSPVTRDPGHAGGG